MIEITFKQHKIIIGKNQDENDQIITDAEPDDYWLHLSDFPSPHVIIKNPSKIKINHKIIKQAAYQLKINSKYRKVENLNIDITKIKHLKKTNIKGMVIINEMLKNISI